MSETRGYLDDLRIAQEAAKPKPKPKAAAKKPKAEKKAAKK